MNLITLPELSTLLKIPEKTIRDWVYKKKIPYYKVGYHIRFIVIDNNELCIRQDPNARNLEMKGLPIFIQTAVMDGIIGETDLIEKAGA